MRSAELHHESVLDLRIRGGLQQILHGQPNMLVLAPTLNQIDDIRDSAVAEAKLLLVESTVFDAARQIVHAFALHNVRQDVFFGGRSGLGGAADPQEVTDAQTTNLEANAMAFQFLDSGVQTAFGLSVK